MVISVLLVGAFIMSSLPSIDDWWGEDIRDHTDDDLITQPRPFKPAPSPTPVKPDSSPEAEPEPEPDSSPQNTSDDGEVFNSAYDKARYYLERDRGIMYFSTVHELQAWVKENIKYQADEALEDYWKSPQKFLDDGGGDCEDYVLFGLATLDPDRYDMKVWIILIDLGVYWSGHVTLVLHDLEAGEYYTWCNWGVRSITEKIWDDPTKLHEYNGYWWVLRERCEWLYHIRSFDAPPDMTKGF